MRLESLWFWDIQVPDEDRQTNSIHITDYMFPMNVNDRPKLHAPVFTFAGLFHSDASPYRRRVSSFFTEFDPFIPHRAPILHTDCSSEASSTRQAHR